MSLIKMKSSVCLLLFFLLSNSAFLLAQDSIAEAKLDAVKIKIGDQTNLNLRVKIKPGSKLKFPKLRIQLMNTLKLFLKVKLIVAFPPIDSSLLCQRKY